MSHGMTEFKRYKTLASEATTQTYTWLLMVVWRNGRYEKTLELPFVPQVGMTIFRGGTQLMWGGGLPDITRLRLQSRSLAGTRNGLRWKSRFLATCA